TPCCDHPHICAAAAAWQLFGFEPPKPRLEAVRIVDMTSSNAWAEFAAIFTRTRTAHLEHEQAKAELKGLMPEDAKEAIGHGLSAKRSKSGAVSFDLMTTPTQEGEPCSDLAPRLLRSLQHWQKRRSNLPIRKSHSPARSSRRTGAEAVPGTFAMRRCRAGSR